MGNEITDNNQLDKRTGSACSFLKGRIYASWKLWILVFYVYMPYVSGVHSGSSAEDINTQGHPAKRSDDNITSEVDGYWNVVCSKNHTSSCRIEFNSSYNVIQKGLNWTEKIFMEFSNKTSNTLTIKGLSELLIELKIVKLNKTSTGDHDADHDEKDHDKQIGNDTYYDPYEYGYDDYSNETYLDGFFQLFNEKCLYSVDDLLQEYYPDVPHNKIEISLSDFAMIVPRLLYELQSVVCQPSTNDDAVHDEDPHAHDHDEDATAGESTATIWCIALVSVLIISLLSVIGIMIVPLMKNSRSFHRLLSFLVALAVGTLVGDALLHLLPHALGDHDHNEHGSHEDKSNIIKSLVTVLGIYFFFIFESAMSMIRKRRNKKKCEHVCESLPKLIISSPPLSDDSLMANHAGANGDCKAFAPHHDPSSIITTNGIAYNGVPVITCKTPPFPLKLNLTENHQEVETTSCAVTSPESVEESPEHHHHHHHDLAQAQSVKDLAWMIIAGDGLHNFSDGLAIGAAFTSSVSAGLSTSLAIFCHELPHEFGDFAILIDAGMSIKKALGYNIMSACVAFIGAVIGLAIGEYASSVKIWILAITAGGFLYVGLVDMLPQMLRQCVEKDGKIRFFFQNLGFLLGVVIMLLIAWFEDSFLLLFNVQHGH